MRAFSIFPPRSSDDAIFTRTFRKLWRWFVRGKGRKLWEQGLSCVTAVRRRPVPRRKARRARPLCVNSRITRCLCFFIRSLPSRSTGEGIKGLIQFFLVVPTTALRPLPTAPRRPSSSRAFTDCAWRHGFRNTLERKRNSARG